MSSKRFGFAPILALSLAIVGCNAQPAISPPSVAPSVAPSTGPSSEPSATPTPLTVGLGFIPSVQFAQFYRAEQAGYYDEAGLDVTFQTRNRLRRRRARRSG